jgi:large subunit ribosomal protein L25
VTGNPFGVKDQGGILEHGTRTLNVMCLPTEIPAAIEVDATPLHIHHSIKIKDIAAAYPQVEFLDDEDTMLAGVIPPNVEVAAVPGVGAEPGVAEPELIRKPGAEEEGEEGKGAAPKGAAPAKGAAKEEKKKEDKK